GPGRASGGAGARPARVAGRSGRLAGVARAVPPRPSGAEGDAPRRGQRAAPGRRPGGGLRPDAQEAARRARGMDVRGGGGRDGPAARAAAAEDVGDDRAGLFLFRAAGGGGLRRGAGAGLGAERLSTGPGDGAQRSPAGGPPPRRAGDDERGGRDARGARRSPRGEEDRWPPATPEGGEAMTMRAKVLAAVVVAVAAVPATAREAAVAGQLAPACT